MNTDDIRKALAGKGKDKSKKDKSSDPDLRTKAARAVQKHATGDPDKFARALNAYMDACKEND